MRSLAFATELVKMGHRVSILLISPENRFHFKEYNFEGVRAIESPDLLPGRLRTGWDPWDTFRRILYLMRIKDRFDLIHCFETRPTTIYPALFLARKQQIPVITDWNDWWGHHGLIDVNRPFWYPFMFGWFETYFEEAFRASAAGLTVIASALKQRGIDLGIDPGRIRHIPGGVFSEQFEIRSTIECRKHTKLEVDGPLLGFSSADSHLDMEIVMDALAIVAKKYPGVRLLITGQAKKEVFDLVRRKDLDERVIFSGYLSREEYPWHLGCADMFLLPMADRPYNHGRWPNKMGDYLASGRPTVSNPVGDIKTLFESHQIGLLAKWDPIDFAEKIKQLLENPEFAQELGQNALAVAKNDYNWPDLAKRMGSFYEKILDLEEVKTKIGDE